MNLEKLKEEFIERASNHQLATLEGDYKSANKQHKKIIKLYQKAKTLGLQDFFLECLDNPDEGVKLWAATASLTIDTKLALECLNSLVGIPSIVSMDAKMVLSLWEKGELELL